MSVSRLVLVIAIHFLVVLRTFGMAGELKQPSIAMPADTPTLLRTQILAALSDPECRFLDGHFINATSTLNYGGTAQSLNRLITKLTDCPGVEVSLTFVKGDPAGPCWTVNHNGWGAAGAFGIQVNVSASLLSLEQLAVSVTGSATKSKGVKQN